MQKERLDSWKSIAAYLQRSTRTVQRWHVHHGLPVHHFGGTRGAAFAYRDEIDAWLPRFSQDASGSEEDDSPANKRSKKLTAIGNELWGLRSGRNIDSICALFREALDEDSGIAAAWVGLANAEIFRAFHGVANAPVSYAQAASALMRACEIDDFRVDLTCASAWLDLAWRREWNKAREGFTEVLRREPANSLALGGAALLHIAKGQFADAWDFASRAVSASPSARDLSVLLCWIPYLAGDHEKALRQISDAAARASYTVAHAAIEALSLIQAGSLEDHVARLEQFKAQDAHSQVLQGALGFHYAKSGDAARAAAILEELATTRDQSAWSYGAALVLLGLGREGECLEALRDSYASRSLWSVGFHFDPILKALGDGQRFHEFFAAV